LIAKANTKLPCSKKQEEKKPNDDKDKQAAEIEKMRIEMERLKFEKE